MKHKPTYEELEQRVRELEQAESKRMQVERENKKNQELLSDLISKVPGVLFQLYSRPDGKMGMYYVSDRSKELFGLKADCDGFFERFTELVISHYRKDFISSIKKVTEEVVPWNFEGVLQKPTGDRIWFAAYSTPSIRDAEILLNGIMLDITERKRAEENLNQKLELLKITESMANIGSWEWDVHNDRAYWSEELFRIFGRDPAEGAPPFAQQSKLYGTGDIARLRDGVEGCIKRGTPYEIEVRAIRSDGEIRHCVSRGQPQYDENGKVFRLVGSFQDITERKQVEKEKEELHRRLIQSQKMESIGNLAGGIAHDFNNILTSIIGFTELSFDEAERGSILEENLQKVYSAGKRAKELVNQILAFARQSEGEVEPLQPSVIANEVLKFIRSSIPTTIEIKQTLNSDSFVMGNPTQIYQVFMNLCANAAYAMEDSGGLMELSIKDITISPGSYGNRARLETGDYIQIKVSDNGTGIPPEIIHAIFEPYFTTKRPGEGTGMGLAMVQGIIEAYGGDITVDSVPGKGSTFNVYLPITIKRKTNHFYKTEDLPSGTERILFVDDEAPIAIMGKRILERLGYSVEAITNSVEALELFKSKPNDFDLVISDMTMPNLTGDMLATELLAIRPDIPVILCTGYSKKVTETSAKEIGIKAFAYKPIEKAELAKTIRKVLDGVNA